MKDILKIVNLVLGFPILVLLWMYRNIISPITGPSCRYQPTCSTYSVEAVRLHGPIKGGWMAMKRIGSCHPWGRHGWDPVPGSELEQKLKDEGWKKEH